MAERGGFGGWVSWQRVARLFSPLSWNLNVGTDSCYAPQNSTTQVGRALWGGHTAAIHVAQLEETGRSVNSDTFSRADELRPSHQGSGAAYFSFLLVQPFSQFSNALIHHCHLGVPLIQQLLVLGQPAALLQVVAITSLKRRVT